MSLTFYKKDDIFKSSSIVFDKSTGGLMMTDEAAIKTQHSLFVQFLAKLGKSLFSANTVGFSLPAAFMEPRSELDRLAELFRIFSLYLCKAGNHPDKLERLKLVSTAVIASSYMMMRKAKSFNPLLGETLQATLADGSKVYCEQICHHPPVSYAFVEGPAKSYVMYGSLSPEPHLSPSYILVNPNFKFTVRFRDGHTIAIHCRPDVKCTGMMSGSRKMLLKGHSLIEDRTLKLRSVLFFDYGEKLGLISSEKTVPKDQVEGIIYAPSGAFNQQARRTADLDDVKKDVARVKGSWLDRVEINAVNYWDINKVLPERISYAKDPLPSDWRLREDLGVDSQREH